MSWPRPSGCDNGLLVLVCLNTSSRSWFLGGSATRAAPPEGGQLPARLLQLRELLRSLERWQHPGRDRKEWQLPLGFLFFR